MNEEVKRKIHEVIKDCAFARDFASGLITVSPRTLESLIFDAIDGVPTAADLDVDAQARRIAEETK
jgi:hypothetical protein